MSVWAKNLYSGANKNKILCKHIKKNFSQADRFYHGGYYHIVDIIVSPRRVKGRCGFTSVPDAFGADDICPIPYHLIYRGIYCLILCKISVSLPGVLPWSNPTLYNPGKHFVSYCLHLPVDLWTIISHKLETTRRLCHWTPPRGFHRSVSVFDVWYEYVLSLPRLICKGTQPRLRPLHEGVEHEYKFSFGQPTLLCSSSSWYFQRKMNIKKILLKM